MMKPIIFNTEMVRAILDKRKTQTRRVIKPQPNPGPNGVLRFSLRVPQAIYHSNPYGVPGDKLWVRETWKMIGRPYAKKNVVYRADGEGHPDAKWKPSIHIPKKFSRITLEVKDVRVERVQDITWEDCIAEGVNNDMDIIWQSGDDTPVGLFGELWDSINEKRGYSWESNPFVWVVEFERISNE